MSLLHAIDGGEISLEIDVDQGGRISSLRFRDIECVLPFRGQVLTWGWYPMAPWAGRIKDGLIKNSKGEENNKGDNMLPNIEWIDAIGVDPNTNAKLIADL